MTTITREWLQQTIAEFENTRDDIPFGLDDDDAKILKVLKQALASFEAEPVGEFYHEKQDGWYQISEGDKVPDNRRIPLYTAPPVPERERIRREHAEWSDKTFGDVGPIGPLKHLSKEALEAAADPSEPLEWADMQFLLWDAQRRMGISDEFITRAMIEKLEINKSRQWPEPKDGEPRLHIKEQPVPVVPETLPCPVHLVPGLRLGKGCKTETLLIALQRRAEYYAGLDAMTPEERAKHDANIEAFKAMLPQPVPAASSESVSQSLTDALRDVIAERQRQVSVKGWTPEHDDTYTCGELSGAAISYIEPMEAVFYWPAEWHDDSFKPSDERRNLVKATALLLAEIERLDRISAASALSEVDRE
ncbi:DUF550 domain-containing protein [Salmonella enterica subsp. enterica serovar Muenster]